MSVLPWRVDLQLQSLERRTPAVPSAACSRRLARGRPAVADRVRLLDHHLSGGFRAGDLVLLGGPQGLGKTTLDAPGRRATSRRRSPGRVLLLEHDQPTLARPARSPSRPAGRRLDAPGLRPRSGPRSRPPTARRGPRRAARRHRGRAEALEPRPEYADRLTSHRCRAAASTGLEVTAEPSGGRARPRRRSSCRGLPARRSTCPTARRRGRPDHRASSRASRTSPWTTTSRCWRSSPATSEGISSGSAMRAIAPARLVGAGATRPTPCSMLNNKYDVVARHHLVYDLGSAERFQSLGGAHASRRTAAAWTGVDLEFRTALRPVRLRPGDGLVAEQRSRAHGVDAPPHEHAARHSR